MKSNDAENPTLITVNDILQYSPIENTYFHLTNIT